MSDVTWPAWMPEPPDVKCGFGAPRLDMECDACLSALLAWYAAAKRCDPDCAPYARYLNATRAHLDATDPTYEAAKRAAFPLPEDADDGNPDGA